MTLDFGTIEVILERYVTKTVGILMKEALFRKAWLRKPVTYPLAKRGDQQHGPVLGVILYGINLNFGQLPVVDKTEAALN